MSPAFANCPAMQVARIGQRVIERMDAACIRIMNALRGAKPLTPPGGSFWPRL